MDAPATDGRAARSRATRARVAAAATRLFTAHGYAATSIQAVAGEAGVATQTVYYAFGNKAAVLKEALDQAVAGDAAPVATLDRPWVRAALNAPDAGEQVRLQVEGTRVVMERVAPLAEVVRGAAGSDPELAELWRTNVEHRRQVQAVFAGALADRGALRPGLGVSEAADAALALLSPEVFTLFTVHSGWTAERWCAWARDALLRQLTDVADAQPRR
ncbi:TetR/AcrR family transcriptional regulator [Nocardiopsis sp. NRRL B-16309]|uniref:TetR/AcrR family transcriptional regulator n=1 Tax=Nocardiopsis sp. NRRL B-16309 TaxID=1519494 RepID=UPI0006AEE99F|nr:TetR/AcrR family transcriptional regulator [Nocardiopsis sp. NRRL B-16309]KOX15686.1 TetR family transcriptional regulator [Nocardiopsis sp. NRRL B-16309]